MQTIRDSKEKEVCVDIYGLAFEPCGIRHSKVRYSKRRLLYIEYYELLTRGKYSD